MIQIKEGDLLPSHYKKASEPNFQGKGVHSVKELEEITEAYKELVHQLRITQQAILEKLGAEIVA